MVARESYLEDLPSVRLSAGLFEPSTKSRGTILFFAGFSGRWEDYWPLLHPLVESYRVIAYSLPGHGGSSGVLDARASIEDMLEIDRRHREPDMPLFYMGHSSATMPLSAAAATIPAGVVLFDPYVALALLPLPLRTIVKAADRLSSPRCGRKLDALLARASLDRLGFHMRPPIANAAALNHFDLRTPGSLNTPLLYFLSDHDVVLGTGGVSRRIALFDALGRASYDVTNASPLVSGFNHCMNYSGYVPFFKDEPGTDKLARKRMILKKMHDFLEKHEPRVASARVSES